MDVKRSHNQIKYVLLVYTPVYTYFDVIMKENE